MERAGGRDLRRFVRGGCWSRLTARAAGCGGAKCLRDSLGASKPIELILIIVASELSRTVRNAGASACFQNGLSSRGALRAVGIQLDCFVAVRHRFSQ